MPTSLDTILKRFDSPDEVRTFEKGRLEIVKIAGQTLGRATYQPGWRWSDHVGPGVNARRCSVEHVGVVLSGHATAAFDDGRVFDLTPGTVFYIPPEPHDSWVVGDAEYVSLHLMGAESYAK
jgi:quercetin dioxygenase-like cupin family protein